MPPLNKNDTLPNDIQHNNTLFNKFNWYNVIQSIFCFSQSFCCVTFLYCYDKCCNAKCHCAECCNAEKRNAECHNIKFQMLMIIRKDVLPNVIMSQIIMPNFINPSIIMLNIIMPK